MKVYLAGPMRGIPEFNFPLVKSAAKDLRQRGMLVFSPAERDLNRDHFDPLHDEAKTLRYYMQYDLRAVCKCDAVVVLPNWKKSQGARLEVYVARECEIPILRYPDLAEV